MLSRKENFLRVDLGLDYDSLTSIKVDLPWTRRFEGRYVNIDKLINGLKSSDVFVEEETTLPIANPFTNELSGITTATYISPLIWKNRVIGVSQEKFIDNTFEDVLPSYKLAGDTIQKYPELIEEYILENATAKDFQGKFNTTKLTLDVKVTKEFAEKIKNGKGYDTNILQRLAQVNVEDLVSLQKSLTQANVKQGKQILSLGQWLYGMRYAHRSKLIQEHKYMIELNNGKKSPVIVTDLQDEFVANGITIGYGVHSRVLNPCPEFNTYKNKEGQVIVQTEDFINKPEESQLLLQALSTMGKKTAFFQPEVKYRYLYVALTQTFLDVFDPQDRIFKLEHNR